MPQCIMPGFFLLKQKTRKHCSGRAALRIKPTKANILDNETKRRSKIPDSAASFGSARRVRTAGQLEDAVRSVQVRDI
jgi:hypothetical protein